MTIKHDSTAIRNSETFDTPYNSKGFWKISNDTLKVFLFETNDSLSKEVVDTLCFIKGYYRINKIIGSEQYLTYHEECGFYDNGQIKYDYSKIKHKFVLTKFHRNGKVSEIINKRKGRKHGIYLKCNDNGFIEVMGQWKRDRKVGRWYYFDEKGNLESIKKQNK